MFRGSGFKVFAGAIERGAVVRAVPAPGAVGRPRSFFDQMVTFAQSLGAPGLGWVALADGEAKGPIAKFLDRRALAPLRAAAGLADGDAVFFVCDQPGPAAKLAGQVRTRVGEELGLIAQGCYRFCWIVDFPMYEWDEEAKAVTFSHNPFSMPQGGMEALESQDPLEILAYQYDIVCNGIELSSGAIRNHRPDIMAKAFELAGYGREVLEEKFGGMFRALQYGAPPHGGIAPGVDRIVMLLADTPNLREVTAFPLSQRAEELLLGAPGTVGEKQLKELNIQLSLAARERLREEADGPHRRAGRGRRRERRRLSWLGAARRERMRAQILRGALEEHQDARVAIVVEHVAGIGDGLRAEPGDRHVEHGLDAVERARRRGQEQVLELLDLLVQLLQLALDIVEPGLLLGLGQIGHQALDLAGGETHQLQRRQRPLRQTAAEPILPVDQCVASPPDLADATDQQGGICNNRHCSSPSASDSPCTAAPSRKQAHSNDLKLQEGMHDVTLMPKLSAVSTTEYCDYFIEYLC